jgi:hypothetical protein
MSAAAAIGQPPLLVHAPDKNVWTVTSSPVPLVSVELFYQGGFWFYRDLSSILTAAVMVPKVYPDKSAKRRDKYFHEALHEASDYVVRQARYRWAEFFSSAQRQCMGQQKCPFPMGGQRCERAPSVGSVWCSWHPLGKAYGRG